MLTKRSRSIQRSCKEFEPPVQSSANPRKSWRQTAEEQRNQHPKNSNPGWGRRISAEEIRIQPQGILGRHHKNGRQPYWGENKQPLRNQEETLTTSKGTTIGGDTKTIYWGGITHLLMMIYLQRTPLGRPKLCQGPGHAAGDVQASQRLYWGKQYATEYTNQPTQLAKERNSIEEQILHRGFESISWR